MDLKEAADILDVNDRDLQRIISLCAQLGLAKAALSEARKYIITLAGPDPRGDPNGDQILAGLLNHIDLGLGKVDGA